MDEDEMLECAFWIALAGGLVITMFSLAPKVRRKQDWVMCVGGLTASFSGVILGLDGFDYLQINIEETLGMALVGGLGFGVLLFAMGYCFEQMQARRILKLQKEAELMNFPRS